MHISLSPFGGSVSCRASSPTATNHPHHHYHEVWLSSKTTIMNSSTESLTLGLCLSYEAATDSHNLSAAPCPHFLPPSRNSFITFRHPGYPAPGNILCRLSIYDGSKTSSNDVGRLCGIHHGTAIQAGSIIACNTTGFLSPTIPDAATEAEPVENRDALLTAKVNYFYSRAWITSRDQFNLAYPVYPSFQDWQFLHNSLAPGRGADPGHEGRVSAGPRTTSRYGDAAPDDHHEAWLPGV